MARHWPRGEVVRLHVPLPVLVPPQALSLLPDKELVDKFCGPGFKLSKDWKKFLATSPRWLRSELRSHTTSIMNMGEHFVTCHRSKIKTTVLGKFLTWLYLSVTSDSRYSFLALMPLHQVVMAFIAGE
ncbi:hypothetical protein KCU62_g41, partial [Aureobasidium sp. EXF-3399]